MWQQSDLSRQGVAQRLFWSNLPLDLVVFASILVEEGSGSGLRIALSSAIIVSILEKIHQNF
jgi:hypothetical protein